MFLMFVVFYRPQTKFTKVMFLHVSVSHSVHTGGVRGRGRGRRVCMAGGEHGWGACMPEVGRGWLWGGGVCVHPGLILRDTVGQ